MPDHSLCYIYCEKSKRVVENHQFRWKTTIVPKFAAVVTYRREEHHDENEYLPKFSR